MKGIKKIFIQIHAISGSLMSAFFLMWCLSGFVLIYVGFPHASRQARFENLTSFNPEDFSTIQTLPFVTGGSVELEKCNGQAVYRIMQGRKRQVVISASTLDTLHLFNEKDARAIAEHFSQSKVSCVDSTNTLDSWIPWTYYKPLLPFYKCYMKDEEHTQIYVSSKTGSIVQKTNRKSRWLGRVGAIPHWIYFKQLHRKANLRKHVVLGIGIISWLACLSGLVVGCFRLNRNDKNRISGITIYKKWWYKWHHILGFVFGLVMFTFVLSGVLYATGVPSWMVKKQSGSNPLSQWNKSKALKSNLSAQQVWDALANKQGVRRIAWGSTMNKPVVKVFYKEYKNPLVFHANENELLALKLSDAEIIQYAQQCFPDQKYQLTLQTEHDYYYEAQGMFKRPLPIYKLDFNNEFNGTLYINPLSGEAVKYLDNNKRARRWLTRALHKFDFPILHKHDTLRKAILIMVLLACLGFSITGLVLSVKWIKRLKK